MDPWGFARVVKKVWGGRSPGPSDTLEIETLEPSGCPSECLPVRYDPMWCPGQVTSWTTPVYYTRHSFMACADSHILQVVSGLTHRYLLSDPAQKFMLVATSCICIISQMNRHVDAEG